jgi:hypothetical protein
MLYNFLVGYLAFYIVYCQDNDLIQVTTKVKPFCYFKTPFKFVSCLPSL